MNRKAEQRLTPRVFGGDWLRGLARRSHSDLVLGRHPVPILRVFDDLLVQIRRRTVAARPADADPARAVREASLDVVAGQRAAAVAGRRSPRQRNGRLPRLADSQLLRRARQLCKPRPTLNQSTNQSINQSINQSLNQDFNSR